MNISLYINISDTITMTITNVDDKHSLMKPLEFHIVSTCFQPDGMLMTLITTLTNEGAPDLTGHLTSGSNKDKKKAFKDIVSAVQDCTEAIVKIMVPLFLIT